MRLGDRSSLSIEGDFVKSPKLNEIRLFARNIGFVEWAIMQKVLIHDLSRFDAVSCQCQHQPLRQEQDFEKKNARKCRLPHVWPSLEFCPSLEIRLQRFQMTKHWHGPSWIHLAWAIAMCRTCDANRVLDCMLIWTNVARWPWQAWTDHGLLRRWKQLILVKLVMGMHHAFPSKCSLVYDLGLSPTTLVHSFTRSRHWGNITQFSSSPASPQMERDLFKWILAPRFAGAKFHTYTIPPGDREWVAEKYGEGIL